MRFRFLHAADLHLDTPFQGVARVSEDVAVRLRDASLDAFDKVVRAALEHDVSFVILAGDLYDGEERGVRAQMRFLRGLEALSQAGIKVFVAHGNHDPVGGWSAIREWPPGVTIFRADEVGAVPVEVGGALVATVYGISYAGRQVTENLALRFPRSAGRAGLRVGVLHCSVGDQPEHSPYAPCSLADLATGGMDYWALGHVHRRAVLMEGGPWVVYPGNTQGRSAKPAEMGAKGAILVEAEGRAVRSLEFIPTDSVRFISLEADISDLGDMTDVACLRNELLRRAFAYRERDQDAALLVRATLRGRGVHHATLSAPGVREGLLSDLRDSTAGTSPPLWWEDLRDETSAVIDLDVVRSRDDFTAGVLARSDDHMADLLLLERLGPMLIPPGPVELLRRCEPLSDGDARRILQAATLLAVEALEAEITPCG